MANIYGTNKDDDLVTNYDTNDNLFGFKGADILSDYGYGVSNNYMYGGTGHDIFESSAGKDHLFGGWGKDEFWIFGDETRWIDGGKGDHDTVYIWDEGDHDWPKLHLKHIEEIVFV